MDNFTSQLAERLKTLRQDADLTLDQLAQQSGVSRATLSRLEKGEVSPTAEVLGKLCAVYGLPMSRLMAMVEQEFVPLVRQEEQEFWHDAKTGFTRTKVSPPAAKLKGEVIRGRLEPGCQIIYDQPSLAGLEHHLVMLDGALLIRIDDQHFRLKTGDCLRYQLFASSEFIAPPDSGAEYLIMLV
ncbi:helix-turn-helix domain-containing protein [Maritalea mediterranea]|uniref:XRE family transcriptional regulator n=1 Tax=Maritalea mediterranea TaxID=2909667 RepID=A0ABS9E7A0_9HYPH|nr:XRE family transcriptional regulator [Maritalea mediterranea]MCF4098062.1 XRE family transcriptional regulator [Maritalea mediterranea]